MRRSLVALAAVVVLSSWACSGASAPQPTDPFLRVELQGATLAEYAADALGARRALVLTHKDLEEASALERTFGDGFEARDGVIEARWRFSTAGLAAATRAVVELLPLDVVVIAAAPPEVLEAIRGLRSAGYSGPILGGASFDAVAWDEQPDWGQIVFAAPEPGGEMTLWRVEDRAKTPVVPLL